MTGAGAVTTVAVDANGADLGPAEVAAGAALAAARGVRVLLFGPAAASATLPAGVEVVDAPVSIAKAADPARAVRATPDASIVRAAQAVAAGRGGRAGRRRVHRRGARRRARSTSSAAAASTARRSRSRCRCPARPSCCSTSARTSRCAPSTSSSSPSWARPSRRRCSAWTRPRVALLSNGEEPTRGTPRPARRARAARGPRRACDFVGNVEGTRADRRRRRRGRHRRLHRQRRAEGDGGGLGGAARRDPQRGATSSPRAKAGGLLLRPALRGLRDELDPEAVGGAYLLGLRRLGVVPHGRFTRTGFASAIALAARGASEDVVERTARRARGGGRAAARAVRRRRLASTLTHEPRPGPRPDPRRTWPTSSRSTRRRSGSPPASRRTSRPTRSTSTRSSRSSRTPTGCGSPTRRRRGS